MSVLLAPSILSADFARLGEEIAAAEAAGADWIHVDVMDGHFVPNLTIGPPVVASLRRVTRLPLDCHLMIEAPERYLEAFARAGADRITVHAEATPHLHRCLQAIHGLAHHGGGRVRAGVALNPATPVAAVEHVLDLVDLVLVMSVNPGFGGQRYLPLAEAKLASLRARIAAAGRPIALQVDGGIGPETAGRAVAAGADVLVAGSAVFRSQTHGKDYRAAVAAIRAAAEEGRR